MSSFCRGFIEIVGCSKCRLLEAMSDLKYVAWVNLTLHNMRHCKLESVFTIADLTFTAIQVAKHATARVRPVLSFALPVAGHVRGLVIFLEVVTT